MEIRTNLLLVARLCLCIFFFTSAIGKMRHHRDFIQGTLNYQVLPERAVRSLAPILPWVELSLALALLVGIALPVVGSASSLLLIAFIAAVGINLRRGRVIPCNCYGVAGTNTISAGTVVRNVLLLLVAAVVTTSNMWSVSLRDERSMLSSVTTILLDLLLLGFSLVTISLLEWAVDGSSRIGQLAE